MKFATLLFSLVFGSMALAHSSTETEKETTPLFLFCRVGDVCKDIELTSSCIRNSPNEPLECSLSGNLQVKSANAELVFMTMGGTASLILTHATGESTAFSTPLKTFMWHMGSYISISTSSKAGAYVSSGCAVYQAKTDFPACR